MTDATRIVDEIRKSRKTRRWRKTWRESRLQPFLGELVVLRKAGASLGALQFWLRTEKGVVIWRSSVKRFLDTNAPGLVPD